MLHNDSCHNNIRMGQAKELLEGVLQMSLGDLQVKASETFNKASELQVAARALHGDDL